MAEDHPAAKAVADGGALRTLASGLVIVRRRKHEWTDTLASMPAEKLAQRTGKVWGSKFAAAWTGPRLTAWIAAQVEAAGWTLDVQEPQPLDVRLNEVAGLAAGKRVHTIRVVCDGRHIHAYPVEDANG